MTVMFPDMMGIETPDELKHMYGDDAVSPGDGDPVVTSYPQFPMSGVELWRWLKGKHPKHCAELQKKYPNYFEKHCQQAFQQWLGDLGCYGKPYRLPKGFV